MDFADLLRQFMPSALPVPVPSGVGQLTDGLLGQIGDALAQVARELFGRRETVQRPFTFRPVSTRRVGNSVVVVADWTPADWGGFQSWLDAMGVQRRWTFLYHGGQWYALSSSMEPPTYPNGTPRPPARWVLMRNGKPPGDFWARKLSTPLRWT